MIIIVNCSVLKSIISVLFLIFCPSYVNVVVKILNNIKHHSIKYTPVHHQVPPTTTAIINTEGNYRLSISIISITDIDKLLIRYLFVTALFTNTF